MKFVISCTQEVPDAWHGTCTFYFANVTEQERGNIASLIPKLTSRWGDCSASRSSRFINRGKSPPVSILYEAGWELGTVKSLWKREK
jgi:hypothetical protein